MGAGGAADALRFAERASADPARAVSRWRSLTGRNAVCCLPLHVPEEIVHAAGMLPVTVWGDERGSAPFPTALLDAFVVPPFPVLPPGAAPSLRAASSGRPCVSLRFRCPAGEAPSAEEVLDGVERLREWAGELSGRRVNDGALAKSIAVYDEHRSELLALERRLAEAPGYYCALELSALLRCGAALPSEAHTRILRAALSRSPAAGRHFRSRLFLAGVVPPGAVMEILDAHRAAVVGWDLAGSLRAGEGAPADRGDPPLVLSRRLAFLLQGLASPGGEGSRAAALPARVAEAEADLVLHIGTGIEPLRREAAFLGAETRKRTLPFLSLETGRAFELPAPERERLAAFVMKGRVSGG